MNPKYFDKVLNGNIQILKVHTSGIHPIEEDYISIRIEDELSSIGFLEIKMDLKSFANCITGSSSQSIEFGIRNIENIGKKLETKIENVYLPTFSPNDREIENAIKPFEIKGWAGSRSDCKNFNNRTKEGYWVRFHRYV